MAALIAVRRIATADPAVEFLELRRGRRQVVAASLSAAVAIARRWRIARAVLVAAIAAAPPPEVA